ncbi:non-ribosomal peptide synthetase [Winogradskyella bathintestinalis]|uniref:Amino acid adenylation domain-containing protein n=1 Tax=Winogradskyella bathintestinalis TaxID=3035208 RepID=A0ABT7ZT57_9FLAO|nr:non-ribosomal peptide synthetase [Winogradskyella bathintestinalis]MDN3492157.1 amino acid adenylation domain-containing protein [Winogradskyella bathintestinalis]
MKQPKIYTTQSQAEIWTACKLGGIDANRGYNESISLKLLGRLNKKAFKKAVRLLVERHESLRSTFSSDGRFIKVPKDWSAIINDKNISECDAVEKDKIIANYLASEANFIFDLVKGPLFKVGLIKLSETEHRFILTVHHLVCDGWSIGNLLEELGRIYTADVLNTNLNLPQPIAFGSYAAKKHANLGNDAFDVAEKYWLNQYKDTVPQLTLPTDFPRPELRTYRSDRLNFSLKTDLVDGLKNIGEQAGCNFINTLLFAFEIFLSEQTGRNDIVLGLTATDKITENKTHMIGNFLNLLPLRSKIDTALSFKEYLEQRIPQLQEAYNHQEFSFGQLLQKFSIARDPSRVPLIPIVFNNNMGIMEAVYFSGLNCELESNPRAYDAFEIFLNVTGSEANLTLEWSFNTALFKRETIKEMMMSFQDLLEQFVNTPQKNIEEILKVDDALYQLVNATKIDYPKITLHQLISKQAQLRPEKIALKFENSEISYKDFEIQVNQLTHCLFEEGVKPGTITAVALPRSIELVISLVAIMQCGAAYLPLDPSYPQQRLDFMMKDSEAEILISSEKIRLKLDAIPKQLTIEHLFSDLSKYSASPTNTAVDIDKMVYLLYTSGSTGNPKGVQVTHRNLVNFLYSMLEKPGIQETDRLLSITTISFDIAGLELYLPLLKGATLVIANDETAKDTRLMLDVLKAEKINILQATPTTWQMLLDAGWENHLPLKALCGGEALSLNLATKLLQRVDELWNMYGPTETTIWSTVKQIKTEDTLISIGKPIANTQLYILNDKGQLMAPGKIGELCIAGDGVAKGYWKRKDLTSEKFIADTFNQDEETLLYRTGDLAKMLPSGEVQCLGRMDQQVKIRGHRIELGEIEEAINNLEDIENSVVLVNEERLEGFVILKKNEEVSTDLTNSWKQSLAEELPAYMVPVDFYFLKEFPTTLNGKIDRNALKGQAYKNNRLAEYTAPRTETEKIVTSIWEDCLKRDKIDIFSDFFELGGHSLIAVKVMSLLDKKTGKRLPLSALMIYPTVEKLAEFIDLETKEICWSSFVPIKPEGTKTPLYVVHGAEHNVLFLNSLAKNLDNDQPMYGLQSKGLDGVDTPHDKIEDMASYYISEIVKSNPEGPYILAGYSFGGVIAFEMARQLMSQNKTVHKVILLDSYVYPYYCYTPSARKKISRTKYTLEMVLYMSQKMFHSKSNFEHRMRLFKESLKQKYLKFKYGKEAHHKMLHSWPFELDQMHKKAINNYQILPLDIKVDLLRVAEDDVFYAHDPDMLGWGQLATKGVNKHLIPGNHVNMLSPPNDKKLGKILQNILDR